MLHSYCTSAENVLCAPSKPADTFVVGIELEKSGIGMHSTTKRKFKNNSYFLNIKIIFLIIKIKNIPTHVSLTAQTLSAPQTASKVV